jgi:hypothetical protein
MHTKVIPRVRPVPALERVLDALAHELIESSDEELLAVAADLGMNLTMRESAAFAGLKYPAAPRIEDFFDVPALQRESLPGQRGASPLPDTGSTRRLARRKRRSDPPDEGGNSGAD